ncbi:MAG TPA: rhomboid family intramembrane serine protease [Longimicrobium sp.]|nr:rhomboid family intramembrane serine protease [Longimicrobium sp.]
MSYRSSYDSYGGGIGGAATPWVKRLLMTITAVFLAIFVVSLFPGTGGVRGLLPWVAFAPRDFFVKPWTLLTYAFVHVDPWHLLGNALSLFFFGPPLEARWGSRGFLKFVAVSAAGGAILSALLYFIQPATFIIGASAAAFGILLAFAMYWPDMEILVFGVFPLKAKWLVGIMVALNIIMLAPSYGGDVAVLAHLGGVLSAFLYLKSPWAPPSWGDLPSLAKRKKKSGLAVVRWGGKKEDQAQQQRTAETGRARRGVPVSVAGGGAGSSRAERDLLDDVDRILDKISAQGLSSLTDEERRRLDEVSRRYRTN